MTLFERLIEAARAGTRTTSKTQEAKSPMTLHDYLAAWLYRVLVTEWPRRPRQLRLF